MRLFILIFVVFSSKAEEKTLILSPGETVFLDRPANQTLRIGDKSLVKVESLAGRISLLATKKGQTRLLNGNQNYQLFILDRDLKRKASHLESLLKPFKGLRWTLTPPETFQILGELYRFSDWLSLKKTFEKQAFHYEFKANMEEEIKKLANYYLKTQLKKPFEILWENLPFVSVPEGSSLQEYQKKLSAFGLKVKAEKNWFFKAPLLEIEFVVVESLSSSSFFSGGSLNQSLSGFSSMLSFLNFLKSSGKGESRRHSSVLVQSGKNIVLESGGQIPFSSFHLKSEHQSTNWKSYGLKLNLKPQLDSRKQIFLQIQARLSEPLALNSVGTAPPLKNQTLETEMVLETGRIFKLFDFKKKSKGRSFQSRLSFLLKELNLLNGSQSDYDRTQFILIRINIVDSQTKKEEEKWN